MKPTGTRWHQVSSTRTGQPGDKSAATDDLFAYGTLTINGVIQALIDRVPSHEPATAPGWQAARLPDRLYPGLVPYSGTARGRLYTDLTSQEWTTLDAFENSIYRLTSIEVLPGPRPALAYTWPAEYLSLPWTVTDLSATDLTYYLERCRAWRQRYQVL